ncbi:MAG TPA: ankyrin repeat domain-containing protein [Vicinamibacterales bacterium]|nr:ankyrin repeat domain-containing protein [Vicinamibacterales bacterium]
MKPHRLVARLARWPLLLLMAAPVFGAGAPDLRLVEAVKNQDRDAISRLLKQRVDVNAHEGDGATALHWAAHRNDLETVDQLIRLGANVNAANDLGVMPLSLACLNANAAIVEKLLAAGANPNATMAGETALMTAARTGSVESVRALLVHGADVNAKEPARGQTALMWAASERHPDVVRALIEAGGNVRARSMSYTMRVNYGGQSNNGGDVNNPVTPGDTQRGGSTPLLLAARNGDVESAGLLLTAGAGIDEALPDGMTALTLAARSGQSAAARFLIEKGADVNAAGVGFTALHAAVLMGDLEVVKSLLAHGAKPDMRLTKPEPIRRGGQDVSLPVAYLGYTPLLLAAKFADAEMERALLGAGADPAIPSKSGTTPLMAAAGLGSGGATRRGVNVLSAYGRLSSADEEKDTFDAVKALLDNGADPNAADPAGNTALFGAVAKGFNTVVQLLVDKGANVNAVNKRGQTLLRLAGGGGGGRGGRNANTGGLERTAALLRKLGATDQAPMAKITVKSEVDYSVAMKEVGLQATALRRATSSEDDAAEAARRLEAIFTEVQAFWAARKIDDATATAGEALASAQAVLKAVAAHDMDGAGQAAGKQLNGTCTTCHTAHRERLPDGTFKLK